MHKRTSVMAFLLVLHVGGCAGLESPPALVSVPDKLKPGAGESLKMVVPARGVQIYECRAGKDQPRTHEWAFVAPEADLFDVRGNGIGRHYAGPHWESADGSRIVGALKERADAPAASAIPWLLLAAKSVGPEGAFSKSRQSSASTPSEGSRPKPAVRKPPPAHRPESVTPPTTTSSPPGSRWRPNAQL